MKKAKTCDLNRCTLCRLCIPGWKPAIEASHQNIQFRKGETIFTEGSEVKGVFYLYEGKAKIHRYWGEGKELIVRFAGEGEIIGHRGFGIDTTYPVSATALTPVTACFFPLSFFMDTLDVNHVFARDLLWFFASELKASEKKMHQLVVMPAKARIANTLLYLDGKFGKTKDGYINIVLSRQDIASFTGVTYETCFRMLQELEGDGLIFTEGKKIRLTGPKGLHELVNS